ELALLQPTPPAVRLFDAGMGDGTVIARLMRSAHRQFPTVPMCVVAKEISLEDVRLGLEKLPDRLFEHPATVFVVTNLKYAEAPHLERRDEASAGALSWQQVCLTGTTADEYAQQIEDLGTVLANQPGGHNPGLKIIQQRWRGGQPFQVSRHELLATLRRELAGDSRHYDLSALPDDEAIFRYEMHTLPSEIGDRIGTSTLFAAWNAAIYVNQIEDERLDAVVTSGAYLEATQRVLRKHGGLWFNDEAFVVARRRD